MRRSGQIFTVFAMATSVMTLIAVPEASGMDDPVVTVSQVLSGGDDAEENSSGVMYLNSSDLELIDDFNYQGVQTVGIRFADVQVPIGAHINSAYIQFTTDEVGSTPTTLTIEVQAVDDAPSFSSVALDITSRIAAQTSATWSPAAWNIVAESDTAQQTTDLASLVTEVVGRTGWTPGNAVVFIISGTGTRTAESFDGGTTSAPTLHLEYTVTAALAADAGPDQIHTDFDGNGAEDISLDGSGSVAGEAAIIDYSWYEGGGLIATGMNPTISRAVGIHLIDLVVTADDTLTDTDQVVVEVLPEVGSAPIVTVSQVLSGGDDAEENSSGVMYLNSSDLELIDDFNYQGVQTVGIRFADVQVPIGAHINSAYIQFTTDEVGSTPTTLTIEVQAVDDAPSFSSVALDITSRIAAPTSATWSPAAWNIAAESDTAQQTTDLASLVTEVVGRTGWTPGNAVVFIISGTGTRTAESFDGGTASAPTLHVEYTGGINRAPTVEVWADSVFHPDAVSLNATVSDDQLPEPGSITYQWSQLSGPGTATFADATSVTTTATFSQPGEYELELTADDGDLSGSDLVPVTSVDPVAGQPETTRFAAIGDYGAGCCAESAVASMIDSHLVDFIVTVGDNRYIADVDAAVGQYYSDYIGSYSGAYGDGAALNRFFPAPGNHDYSEVGGFDAHLEYFVLPGGGITSSATSGSERYYDFVRGPVHFFVVNSNVEEPDGNTSTSDQALWLQSQLAESQSPWKVVALHHAPFSSGSHGSDPVLQWPFEAWGADTVIAGHDHIYERIMRSGFPYFVNGTGGQSLYASSPTPDPDSAIIYADDYGAMIVEACAARIVFEFHSVSEGLIDSHALGASSCFVGPAGPSADAGADQILTDLDNSGDEDVGFDGSGSAPGDSAIVIYEWFDGASSLGFGVSPTFALAVGSYTITLEVTDGNGLTATDTVDIDVKGPAGPSADAGPDQVLTDTDGGGDEGVSFDGSGSGPGDSAIVTYEWFDGASSLGFGVSPAFTLEVGSYTITLEVTDGNGLTAVDTVDIDVNEVATETPIYMSFTTDTTLPGGAGTASDEDIVSYDPDSGIWAIYIDGSDIGLAGTDINAFHILDDGTILMSFNTNDFTLAGVTGGPNGTTVDDSDIVLFTPITTGDTTTGTFTFYLDGSDISLTNSGEDIDGLHEYTDGTLAISTTGRVRATALVNGRDEDIHLFVPITTGAATTGTWTSIHLDGSDVGLTTSTDDLKSISLAPNADLLFTTAGTNTVFGTANEDINRFVGTYGPTTTGTFSLEHDLSTLGIATGEAIDGLHIVY